jgi:PAS domain S-box-containing protein
MVIVGEGRSAVAQQPIEMILLHLWASYIAIPIWVVDIDGNLVYYNEPAEQLLGKRFDEVGEINASELAELFVTTDIDGEPLPNKEIPLVIALSERIPAHRRLRFRAFDGSWRDIEVAATPIEGQGSRLLGALATFWETQQ